MERKNNRRILARAAVRAFTLIELLVVISIIAVLAGLVASLLPAVGDASKRKNAQGQLGQLVLAIENYKQTRGYYPPSSTNINKAAYNTLFYELTGTVDRDIAGKKEFTTVQGNVVQALDLKNATDLEGILNSDARTGGAKNFLSGWRDSNVKELTVSGKKLQVLVVPVKAWTPLKTAVGEEINPWQYDSASSTRHNAESFDLWADIMIGGKKVTISNWKQ